MGVVITSLALFAAAATAIFVPILLLNTYAAVYELSHLHDFILLDKAKAVDRIYCVLNRNLNCFLIILRMRMLVGILMLISIQII